jgi:uncharacterized protein (DUF2147 family)
VIDDYILLDPHRDANVITACIQHLAVGMNRTIGLLFVIAMVLAAPASAAAAGPLGRWLSASGNVEVTIQPCGPSLCGAVSRVFANNSMEHPGPASSPPARIGLQIMSDFRPDGDGWTGKLFNRENGNSYDCHMTLHGPNGLAMRAYVLLPIFGKTQIWRRLG